MNIRQKLHDFRKVNRQWALYVAVLSIGVVVVAYWHHPEQIWEPASWPALPILAFSLVTAYGVVFRREWSRYSGLLLTAVVAYVVAIVIVKRGFTMFNILNITGVIYMAHGFWTVPITPEQERRRAESRNSGGAGDVQQIVLLLREPIPERVLHDQVHAAQGAGGAVPPGPAPEASAPEAPAPEAPTLEAPTLEGPTLEGPSGQGLGADAEGAPVQFCFGRHCTMLLYRADCPYSGAMVPMEGGEAQPAFGHRASIRIQHLPSSTAAAPSEMVLGEIANLAAGLIDARCVGLYFPNETSLVPISPQVVQTLRSTNPENVLKLAMNVQAAHPCESS